jgi:predicted O-methyltransferase YrrM
MTIPEEVKSARGWLAPEERELLYRLARETGPGATILNIGVEYGASLVCLHHGNPLAHLHGVDLNVRHDQSGVSRERLTLHELDSAVLAQSWATPLDLLFVDGDHSEAGVLADTRFCDWLRAGAAVVFHDCYEWDGSGRVHQVCPGVNAAVASWALRVGPDFIELPPVVTSRVFRRLP